MNLFRRYCFIMIGNSNVPWEMTNKAKVAEMHESALRIEQLGIRYKVSDWFYVTK